MNEYHYSPNILARWRPPVKEWDPDPRKPFLVEVLKQAVFSNLVDWVFLRYFKNSLAVMCEAWLKRQKIDPTINTSKNYHKLQDEFFKVLAHINRGFECEVNANWKAGVGLFINLWHAIEKEEEAQWIDHKAERRKGDPVSRYELAAEPKQDAADAFLISMFRKGRRIKEHTLAVAQKIDAQQSRFFVSLFEIEEHRTFTETKITLINNTQEEWLNSRLSSKLGLGKELAFLEETFGASVATLHEAHRIILSGNAKVWLINDFFRLHKRHWGYLLETLTGGHVAFERLFGSVITTLVIGRDRKTFEVREEDAEELFKMFWKNKLTLPFNQAERIACMLHEAVINTGEYHRYNKAAALFHALEAADKGGKRYKTLQEAETVLRAVDPWVKELIAYPVNETGVDFSELHYPLANEKEYEVLLAKLTYFLKLEMEIHQIVESIFWYYIQTFGDLVRAYQIQQKKRMTGEEQAQIKEIAFRNHLLPEETNFLVYAPDRCYIGKELQYFQEFAALRRGEITEIRFEKKTQQIKKNYVTPPLRVRRDLTQRCGRYGKLLGDLYDKQRDEVHSHVKMIWNPPKIQITDLDYLAVIRPRTAYEITITSAEPRKPRERWE